MGRDQGAAGESSTAKNYLAPEAAVIKEQKLSLSAPSDEISPRPRRQMNPLVYLPPGQNNG